MNGGEYDYGSIAAGDTRNVLQLLAPKKSVTRLSFEQIQQFAEQCALGCRSSDRDHSTMYDNDDAGIIHMNGGAYDY